MQQKVLGLSLIVTIALSTVGFANPTLDLAKGQTAFDVHYGSPSVSNNQGYPRMDGRGSLGFGITTGPANRFALQYKYNNFKTNAPAAGNPSMIAQELNVLYMLDKSLTVFVGGARFNMTNGLQFGVIGTSKITEKTKAYSAIGLGKIQSYEIGVGYEIDKSTEFKVGYRNAKYNSNDVDFTLKGINTGVTFKF